MRISTPGVVIRSFKHEQNRILTLLTKDLGVVTAFANNRSGRLQTSTSGATELLCYADFVLFKSRGKYLVDSADSRQIFFGIRSEYENLALASYFCQLMGELAPSEEPASAFVQLLLGCLHYLESQTRPAPQLKAILELRGLTLAGYMPDLVGCRVCGSYNHSQIYFTPGGELLCGDCLGQSDQGGLVQLSQGVLQAMRHIVYAQPEKLFSFTLSPQGLTLLGKISESYLLFQLEKTLPALEFYRGLA